MSHRFRQEVLNVLLAQLLAERGVIAAPESIIKAVGDKSRSMPDVIVSFQGLRTAIEGEIGDQPNAEKRAAESALSRVESGIAHIGIAVVYPPALRDAEFPELRDQLARADLGIAVITESGKTGFTKGTVDHLESALRNSFDQLVREDTVAKAKEIIDAGIRDFATAVSDKRGTAARLADTLGIRIIKSRKAKRSEE